jgi:arylformamidase
MDGPRMTQLFRSFSTQEQIDAEYRVAHSTAELMQSRARAEKLSADARSKLRHVSRVAYGPTRPEYLDIFPAATGDAPVLVFFHGGYWRAMSSEDFSFVAVGPVANGVLTVSVNYALAPSVGVTEIVRQARAALAWIARNISGYGGDPNSIVVAGHSAGAQLAAMCLLTNWDNDYGLSNNMIRGGLLVSGVFDLAPLRYSYLQPQLQLDEQTVSRNSPVNLIRGGGAPVMLAVGEMESAEFHRQSLDFHTRWQRAANVSVLETVNAARHFAAIEPLLNLESSMCRWMVERVRGE